MRIRLIGLPDEVMAAAERIATVMDLVETSPALPCRGSSLQVRVYLEVRLTRPTTVGPPDDGVRLRVVEGDVRIIRQD